MASALLSVSDKTGIIDFARGLASRGITLVSTGGTARELAAAGLAVTNVSERTGFPEMLDGRVKTLHPAIHGGILARRGHPADLEAIARHGIQPIDIVVVNLYPFAETAQRPGVGFDDLVEQIDIGGPSLLRAAAKNFRDVLVVVEPKQYDAVIEALDREQGPSLEFRLALAHAAIAHTARYDTEIAATLSEFAVTEGRIERQRDRRDDSAGLELTLAKLRDLRYGENPHQKAALYASPSEHLAPWEVRQGKELSFTNLLDLDAAARIVLEFDEPAAVVVKHTNPCGAGIGQSAAEAYVRAREADRVAAFGGIVALNRAIDVAAADAITSSFIEAVIAPAIEDSARSILARKTNMRVVIADFAAMMADRPGHLAEEFRSTLAGVLAQERDRVVEARLPWLADALPDGVRVVTKRAPTADEWTALRFAWRICAHVKSNTVIFTTAERTLAIGAGQMSRVDAVHVAVMKAAAGALAGSVAASDAYFPFRDGLDAVAKAGATAVVQPGGSVRDPEVIAAADEHGVAMVFTGRRHFRH
jgi:phosphoribosylaminoimidazolecarboxamide formyltransferase/IMP cyclohydrolase